MNVATTTQEPNLVSQQGVVPAANSQEGDAAAAPSAPPRMLLVSQTGINPAAAPAQAPRAAPPVLGQRAPATIMQAKIPAGLRFTGDANYNCSVLIDGEVEGSVVCSEQNSITVQPSGKVKGDLRAYNVRIEGTANGNIDGTGGLTSFGPQSSCTGNVTYTVLSIEQGAEVEATTKRAKVASS